MAASSRVGRAAAAPPAARRRRAPRPAGGRGPGRRGRAAPCRSRSPGASRPGAPGSGALPPGAPQARDSSSSIASSCRATSASSAVARSTRAACAARASATRRLMTSAASRASWNWRCAIASRSSAASAHLFLAGDRLPRLAPRAPRASARSSCGPGALGRQQVGLPRQAVAVLAGRWPPAPRSRRSPSPARAPRRRAGDLLRQPIDGRGRLVGPLLGEPPGDSPNRRRRGRASSLTSRLVERMPRDSSRTPPYTRCAPRNTSPSGVTTGRSVSREASAAAGVERRGDPRVADRLAG